MRIAVLIVLSLGAGVRALTAQCPDGSPPPCRPRPGPPSTNSVAVLYFDNPSHDSVDALLADGFSEELMARLGRVGPLQVKSRGVVQRFRGQVDPTALGRALNVAYVVSGSMRHSGDRVRITAEMSRSSNGTQVWADVFDRSSADLMTIEADLAEAVATAIAGQLQPRDQALLTRRLTRMPAAWEAYLRGNALIARRITGGLPGAITAYREAVRLDPNFAAAWGRLAEGLVLAPLYGLLDPSGDTTAMKREAGLAAARALTLDSTSAETWIAQGMVAFAQGPPLARIAPYARAVTLDSNLAEAHYHLGSALRALTEDQASAERHLRRAHALDPSLVNAVEWLVWLLWQGGRPFEALAWDDTLAEMAPDIYRFTDVRLDLLLRTGDTASARRGLADLLAAPRSTDSLWTQALGARVTAELGDTARAMALLRAAEQSGGAQHALLGPACILASAYAALGEREHALTLLEAQQIDGPALWDQLRNPYFDSLRREPRFARLFESVQPR